MELGDVLMGGSVQSAGTVASMLAFSSISALMLFILLLVFEKSKGFGRLSWTPILLGTWLILFAAAPVAFLLGVPIPAPLAGVSIGLMCAPCLFPLIRFCSTEEDARTAGPIMFLVGFSVFCLAPTLAAVLSPTFLPVAGLIWLGLVAFVPNAPPRILPVLFIVAHIASMLIADAFGHAGLRYLATWGVVGPMGLCVGLLTAWQLRNSILPKAGFKAFRFKNMEANLAELKTELDALNKGLGDNLPAFSSGDVKPAKGRKPLPLRKPRR